MDLQILTEVFMWCTILNVGILACGVLLWVVAGDVVYAIHGRWFPMPRETFNAVFYAILGVYKILILALGAVPWAALALAG